MRRINLLEEPVDVQPPDRLIYSTRPKKALAEDGLEYIPEEFEDLFLVFHYKLEL